MALLGAMCFLLWGARHMLHCRVMATSLLRLLFCGWLHVGWYARVTGSRRQGCPVATNPFFLPCSWCALARGGRGDARVRGGGALRRQWWRRYLIDTSPEPTVWKNDRSRGIEQFVIRGPEASAGEKRASDYDARHRLHAPRTTHQLSPHAAGTRAPRGMLTRAF